MFINGFIFFSSIFYIPQFYQTAHQYSPLQSAMLLIPLLVSQMAASWVAGMIVSKTGRYRVSLSISEPALTLKDTNDDARASST